MRDLVARLRDASFDDRLATGMLYREAADELVRLAGRNVELEEMGRAWHESDEHKHANRLRNELERLTGQTCDSCACQSPVEKYDEETTCDLLGLIPCANLGHRCGAWQKREWVVGSE